MREIRMKIYQFLVNRQPGIAYRYHKSHDGSQGIGKALSWAYLLWLNFAYYILFLRFLGRKPEMAFYEEKKPMADHSESEMAYRDPAEEVSMLSEYDIISFDVFDTLLFRPLSQPTDLFYFVGKETGILDYKGIRVWAEYDARVKCHQKNGHMEVTLADIRDNLIEDVGNSAMNAMEIEQTVEENLCYANPFMLEVWKRLQQMGKKIIVVSDMYLPEQSIRKLLEKNGFAGAEQIYVSCEYRKSKADGGLYEIVKGEWEGKGRIIHVGDNPRSDQAMAKKAGIAACSYPQVNRNMLLYRPYDMSYLVGSGYRGIVSNWLYNGLHTYSMEYEYGFIYGGLFVLGYCEYIHEYYEREGLDKILFLSRDGDILKKAYNALYPEDVTEYVYWSRKAATKLMAAEDKHDYFRRFLYHKQGQGYTIREILSSMELEFLADELGDWHTIWLDWIARNEADSSAEHFVDLRPEEELTEKNGFLLRRFIEAKWDAVREVYESQLHAAEVYYRERLSGCSRVAAVDIGWAGSGAMALSHLVEQVWKMPCVVTGIVAGTNTPYNAEPDASEPFLQSGKLVAYLYSQSHNRDLLKKHDPNKDYNVYWELLLSSPQPQFVGFYEAAGATEAGYEKDPQTGGLLRFGKRDIDPDKAAEIQRGILDFVKEYSTRFRDYPYMLRISGRDAYAPMLAASGADERYLKAMAKRFALQVNVE